MTVTDCHHEKTAVQKRKHAKKFSLFGKGLQTTSTDFHQKSAKKPEKLGSGGRRKSNTYLTHDRKKVIFFSHIKGTETTSFDFHLLLHQRVTELQTNILKKLLYILLLL